MTSSIEKREQLAETEKKEQSSKAEAEQVEAARCDDQTNEKSRVRESAAFKAAASAASYLHSRTKILFPSSSSSSKDKVDQHADSGKLDINSEMATLMATTDSVTAVVGAKEEVKQAVADDLSSISSSPCEWYICDDDKSATRYFIIQVI